MTLLRMVVFLLLAPMLIGAIAAPAAVISTSSSPPATAASAGVYHCGGVLNGTRGYFHTPNFPDRFPCPISCQWLLHAPPGKRIALYFTQYYLRVPLAISEFEFYRNESFYVGRVDIGHFNFLALTYMSIEKPFMLVRFQRRDMRNIHMRADAFLLDVYGFNVTYEIRDVTEPIRTDTCSVAKCSYLGQCWASHDFSDYECQCFGEHYGRYCQYGPFCDPYGLFEGINMCQNWGRCR